MPTPDPYTQAYKEALASVPSDDVVLETLEISHSLLSSSIFLVKNREDLTFTLEDSSTQLFTGCGFGLVLPPAGADGLQELQLQLDNIDLTITDFVNTVKRSREAVVVKYRPYLSSDLTTPQMSPPLTLTLSDIIIGTVDATGKASFADILNKKAPSELYSRNDFPSLGN